MRLRLAMWFGLLTMQIVNLKSELDLNVEILNPEGIETVVMLHGMFGNMAQFYLTIAPAISKHYKVVLFDLKSHGRSSKKNCGYDLKTMAAELIELIDALGLEKVHLLGHSYGSLIALKCAMDFPERVNKVIAIEVPDKPRIPFQERGTYTFDDFWRFVEYLNAHIRKNFFRSKRQIQQTFNTYEYMFNHTTFSHDMNSEEEFLYEDYQKIESPVLLGFGHSSVCIGEFERIKNWITHLDVYLDEGDHGFFMDKPEESSMRFLEFLSATK